MELDDCLCGYGWGRLEEDVEAEKVKMSELKLVSLCGCKGSPRKSEMVPLSPDKIPGMRGSEVEPLVLWVGTPPELEEWEMTGALL